MIPPFITASPSINVATFPIGGAVTDSDLNLNKSYTWTKPPGVAMIYFWIVGMGGNGYSVPIGITSGGGGGGGGAFSSYLVPAMFIPDTLIITNPNGNSNAVRIIEPTSNYLILAVGSGTASTGTVGGAAGGVSTNASLEVGIRLMRNGVGGVAGGGPGATGTDVAARTQFNTGGAGGGGASLARSGGIVPVASGYPYPVLTSAAAGTAGAHGYQFLSQLAYTTPGAGGGGGITIGGAGGFGALSCGGGGGGGNPIGQGPSQGGRGGPGLVIIYSW